MYSNAEEDHIKAIYSITERNGKGASTNAVAQRLETKASSVTDMVKKLSDKGLVDHQPYHGVSLTKAGRKVALAIIRKHRLWETFLVRHLAYRWDQVHELAEQLEHIRSGDLIDRLDRYMGHPKFDPHGDPIPDKQGRMSGRAGARPLAEVADGASVDVVGVKESSPEFLQLLDRLGLGLGTRLKVVRRFAYDNSIEVDSRGRSGLLLNERVCGNLIVSEP